MIRYLLFIKRRYKSFAQARFSSLYGREVSFRKQFFARLIAYLRLNSIRARRFQSRRSILQIEEGVKPQVR